MNQRTISKLMLIAKNEIKMALREKLVLSLGLMVSLLLGVALYAGYLSYQQQQKTISQKQDEKRREWLGQGDKHPHIAAHYGTFAFKPKTVFSMFDFGLDTFTGTSVYLEAHNQHEFMFRPAQDHSSMIRFGELSAALVLQVLVPLLIIFLAFASFTKERESGTLRLLISQGATFRALAWGKIMAYLLILLALLTPFLIGIGVLSLLHIESGTVTDATIRIVLLILLYALYLFLFISFSVWVSLRSSTGKNALLTMLTFWIVFTMLMPKTVSNMGESLYQLPSMRVFKARIQKDIDHGLDGKSSRSIRFATLETTYLEKYKVDSVQELPFNFEGISMQAGEEHGNTIYDHHLKNLRETFHRQNHLGSMASLLNPFLAVQHLSMSLCATDLRTSLHFEDKVEEYRRQLVRAMNNDMAQNSSYGEFYEYTADSDLWKRIEDFSYETPSAFTILGYYKLEMVSLFLWMSAILLLLFFSNQKTSQSL